MKRIWLGVFGLFALLAASGLSLSTGGGAVLGASNGTTYRVEIENLTPGQPFTPPVLAAHSASMDLFEGGQAASAELQQIAENGNNAPMVAALEGSADVFSVVVGDGPVFPGQTLVVIIEAPAGSQLSLVSMLICTNDGFTAIDSMDVDSIGASTSVDAEAYDAGTEINTEDFKDIVPPCQGIVGVSSTDEGTGASNPDLAEGGLVSMHGGVIGGNDLVSQHSWNGPVARVTITEMAPISPPSTGSAGLISGQAGTLGLYLALAGIALVATSIVSVRSARRS